MTGDEKLEVSAGSAKFVNELCQALAHVDPTILDERIDRVQDKQNLITNHTVIFTRTLFSENLTQPRLQCVREDDRPRVE